MKNIQVQRSKIYTKRRLQCYLSYNKTDLDEQNYQRTKSDLKKKRKKQVKLF